jgi:hypothetical protein
MLKGLAVTPPVLGRICIGRVIEKNGKRLPEKDDEFTVTSQVQGRDGWVPHPVDAALRKSPGEKLRSIPVRLLFNDPELNMRASYSMFDRRTGRPLCVGNGTTCKRSTLEGMKTLECPSPESCEVGQKGGCKPYARLNVRIGEDDELGSFIFRTTGFNSIRTLTARMRYFEAVTNGMLSTLPLELRLRGKSTAQSHGAPVYFVDITLREGSSLIDAIQAARVLDEQRRTGGVNQQALEDAARAGFAVGAFEESPDDGEAVTEEFYSPAPEEGRAVGSSPTLSPTLAEKLERKANQGQTASIAGG